MGTGGNPLSLVRDYLPPMWLFIESACWKTINSFKSRLRVKIVCDQHFNFYYTFLKHSKNTDK